MAIYMDFGEGEVKGNVTAQGHEEWIDCSSLQFGAGRAITTTVGSADEREASQPSISEMTITKEMDIATAKMFSEATVGQPKKVVIHLCKTGTDEIQTYMEYILEDCMVSGYSVSASGDGRPSESVSLSFGKIIIKYFPFNAAGVQGSPIPAGYDLITGTKV